MDRKNEEQRTREETVVWYNNQDMVAAIAQSQRDRMRRSGGGLKLVRESRIHGR